MSRFDELEARIAQLEAQRSAHEDDIQTLEKRLDFETLLSDLSSAFVNLPDDSVNSEIENWLRRIVVSLGVERCTVAAMTDDGDFSVLYSWSAPGFQSVSRHQTRADCPWCEEKIGRGETVALASLEDLPSEAEIDRRSLQSLGTKSCLILPMKVGGCVHGMLAFGMLSRERAWRDELQTRLELIAQVFANALARKKSQIALRYRIEFENLLSEISTRFINIGLQDIEAEIGRSLKRIAQFAGTDSGYVNLFFDEKRQFRMNYLWQNQHGIFRKDELANLKVSDFPWVVDDVLLAGTPSVISSIHDLPKEASREEAFFESLGVKSLVDVPMVLRGDVIGFTGFACTRDQRTWTDDEVSLLKMVGQIFTNAIERTKIGTELRERDQQIRDIVEASRDWVWSAGADGVHTYSSPAIASILGYTPEEMKGENVFEFMHPEDMQKVRAALSECVKERRGWSNLLVRWRHKDGSWRFLESNAVPVLDANDQIIGFRGVDRDITERKNAQDALQTSEGFLQDVFDAIRDGICVVDSNLTVVRTNLWMEQMYAEQMPLIGRKCYEVYQHRESPCPLCPAVRTVETGEACSEIVPYPSEKNPTGWIEMSTFPIKDETGRVTSVIEYVKDITDRKRAVEELRTSEERFRTLFESMKEGVCLHEVIYDDSGKVVNYRILDTNPQYEKILGIRKDDVVGKLANEAYGTEEPPYLEEFTGVVGTGRARYMETYFPPMDKHFSISIFSPEKGKFATVFADISDRKISEQELQNALDEIGTLKERLEAENVYLQEEIRLEHDFGEIVGKSKGLMESLMKVEQVAGSDSTVLVLGETGTGKELIARAVHALSDRRDRPLVKVNCAALPSTLIESDLFGHVKGAFTGAMARKTGRFELADGGTIFLDEIGDLPPDMQTKLLRVLQEGEFERVGDPKTISVDVRVIAATNRNLADAVKSGKFRQDLYYRLNVFPIEVPPLRERKEDIPLLAKYFVAKFNKKIGKKIEKIPKSVLTELQDYEWPGNVRGLENVIERSMIMSRGDQLELGDWLRGESPAQPEDKPRTLEKVERDHIIETLKLTEWRVSGDRGAAKVLGMNPKTLESRMKKLGISRPK